MYDEPTLEYGHYPPPVEDNAISYDRLWAIAHGDDDAIMLAMDVPGYSAIYHCRVPVSILESPLRSLDPEVRLRAVANVMRLVGRRVAEAAKD